MEKGVECCSYIPHRPSRGDLKKGNFMYAKESGSCRSRVEKAGGAWNKSLRRRAEAGQVANPSKKTAPLDKSRQRMGH